jgi:hypothetical protein
VRAEIRKRSPVIGPPSNYGTSIRSQRNARKVNRIPVPEWPRTR